MIDETMATKRSTYSSKWPKASHNFNWTYKYGNKWDTFKL